MSIGSVNDIDDVVLDSIAALAESAGDLIMGVYGRGTDDIVTYNKEDHSPLTEADLLAHDFLCEQLSLLTPDIPVLSEEGALPDYGIRKQWQYYWLIDPLDGTKEFLSRNGEFTVNIALIYQHRPVLGVVYAPAKAVLYKAINVGAKQDCSIKVNLVSKGTESLQQKVGLTLQYEQLNEQAFRVVISRHHGAGLVQMLCDHLQEYFGLLKTKALGSSLKLCAVADGQADLYPRFGPTSEWDIAAGQAIVEAAGGSVVNTQLEPLRYNTKDSILNPDFYALGNNPGERGSGSALKNYFSLLVEFTGKSH